MGFTYGASVINPHVVLPIRYASECRPVAGTTSRKVPSDSFEWPLTRVFRIPVEHRNGYEDALRLRCGYGQAR